MNHSQRYKRQVRLPEIGNPGQEKISRAKVLVVGTGALGCAALSYLAPAGIGTIGILDNDAVEESNLHRQILFATRDIDKPKPLAATERLRAVNPDIKLIPHFLRLSADNALDLFKDYDLILECSDNFPTKFLVNDACVMLNMPCIIGSAIGFSGQLSVYNYQGGPTYRCLLPEPPDPLLMPTCADAGVMGMIPGIIGNLQALEAIKIITRKGDVLSGRLLHFEGLEGNFMEIPLALNPENKRITQLVEYELSCPDLLLKKHLIGGKDFLNRLQDPEKYTIVAIGEDEEPLKIKNHSWSPVPLHKVPELIQTIPRGKKILLICEYGIKSNEAIKYLLVKEKFRRAFGLKDGLSALRILA